MWLTFSSIILAFSFMFGTSIANMYQAVVFLFVVGAPCQPCTKSSVCIASFCLSPPLLQSWGASSELQRLVVSPKPRQGAARAGGLADQGCLALLQGTCPEGVESRGQGMRVRACSFSTHTWYLRVRCGQHHAGAQQGYCTGSWLSAAT